MLAELLVGSPGCAAPSALPRPPRRIASSTSSTGASRTSSQAGKRSRRRGVGEVAVAVVGVLREDRHDQLVDRVAVRPVDRPARRSRAGGRGSPARAACPGASKVTARTVLPLPMGPKCPHIGRKRPIGIGFRGWHGRGARACGEWGAGFYRRVPGEGTPTGLLPRQPDPWWRLDALSRAGRAGDRDRLPWLGRSDRPDPARFDYSMHGLSAFLERCLDELGVGSESSSSTTGAAVGADRSPAAPASGSSDWL